MFYLLLLVAMLFIGFLYEKKRLTQQYLQAATFEEIIVDSIEDESQRKLHVKNLNRLAKIKLFDVFSGVPASHQEYEYVVALKRKLHVSTLDSLRQDWVNPNSIAEN